ncbi:MAG: hypothetical protein ACREUT_20345 [Steroidobacteraceae bacterium]
MIPVRVQLLKDAAATGNGLDWPGGRALFSVLGTFGGATVTLQYLGPDDVTWVEVATAAALTAAGNVLVDVPAGLVRAAVTSGPPSGLYADLRAVLN